jgi:hypothetical protein
MALSRLFHSQDDAQAVAAELKKIGLRDAAVTVSAVAGGFRVIADAPLGTAAKVTRILESRAPAQSAPVETVSTVPTIDDRSTVILLNHPSPISSFFFLPVLTDGSFSLFGMFGIPALTKGSGFLSSLFGLPVLGGGASPLSSAIGLKTVTAGGPILPFPTLWK